MKKITLILSFFLLTGLGCIAQDKEPSDFIPKGYVEHEKYLGDLNDDGQKDCVLIIKKTDPTGIVTNRFDEEVDRNRRGIVVLFKNEKGYELIDKNVQCFSSENEDGGVYYPPELSIKIDKEKL